MHCCWQPYCKDSHGIVPLLAWMAERDPEVRCAVASSLPQLAGESPEREMVTSLLELMGDADARVRDWATFGIGEPPRCRRTCDCRLSSGEPQRSDSE